jgi:hypothetical protein
VVNVAIPIQIVVTMKFFENFMAVFARSIYSEERVTTTNIEMLTPLLYHSAISERQSVISGLSVTGFT